MGRSGVQAGAMTPHPGLCSQHDHPGCERSPSQAPPPPLSTEVRRVGEQAHALASPLRTRVPGWMENAPAPWQRHPTAEEQGPARGGTGQPDPSAHVRPTRVRMGCPARRRARGDRWWLLGRSRCGRAAVLLWLCVHLGDEAPVFHSRLWAV